MRKPKLPLDLETDPDIKIAGTYREYYMLLGKRLQYLHKQLQDFRMKRLALINKDRDFFQYSSGYLVYIISPLTILCMVVWGQDVVIILLYIFIVHTVSVI